MRGHLKFTFLISIYIEPPIALVKSQEVSLLPSGYHFLNSRILHYLAYQYTIAWGRD